LITTPQTIKSSVCILTVFFLIGLPAGVGGGTSDSSTGSTEDDMGDAGDSGSSDDPSATEGLAFDRMLAQFF
jgi:hypothetical protein